MPFEPWKTTSSGPFVPILFEQGLQPRYSHSKPEFTDGHGCQGYHFGPEFPVRGRSCPHVVCWSPGWGKGFSRPRSKMGRTTRFSFPLFKYGNRKWLCIQLLDSLEYGFKFKPTTRELDVPPVFFGSSHLQECLRLSGGQRGKHQLKALFGFSFIFILFWEFWSSSRIKYI